MSRWWRAYDEALHDPKLIALSDRLHRAWFSLLCVASKHGGILPTMSVVAIELRVNMHKAAEYVTALVAAGLIDEIETGKFAPHNWRSRQFQSDVSTERVKRFRQHQRNVSSAVSETPPETDNRNRKKDTELRSAGDPRADLFDRGLKTLVKITGKTPDSARSLIGKWLKSVSDEAIHVLGAIDDAERNGIADPVAWINRSLAGRQGKGNGKTTIHDATDNLLDKLRALDAPAPGDLRNAAGQDPVRRLPAR